MLLTIFLALVALIIAGFVLALFASPFLTLLAMVTIDKISNIGRRDA
jgi:hypothetical protein